MKKYIISYIVLFMFYCVNAQKLIKIWETEAVFDTPESVLVDQKHKCIYVANIGGNQPWAKDGNGFISKLTLDGKMIKKNWVSGLHAPKGMAIVDHTLYVADVDRIVAIDMHKGMISTITPVLGSLNLNDIAPFSKTEIIFSDSGGRSVYTMSKGNYTKIIDSTFLKRPNGVLINANTSFVLDNDAVNVWKDGKLTKIVDGMPGGVDGIEPINANEYIVSCWSGTVYHVNVKEKTKKLL
ncbi:MAG TPA: hypothetical protein PKD85_08855, partial [Saprospiraceae bacterium]|nr:hypothetical protein [Saprospiraceae bacterium]